MKKTLLFLALTAAAAAPAAAQFVTPYYDYFGQNKIQYRRFDWRAGGISATHHTAGRIDQDHIQVRRAICWKNQPLSSEITRWSMK